MYISLTHRGKIFQETPCMHWTVWVILLLFLFVVFFFLNKFDFEMPFLYLLCEVYIVDSSTKKLPRDLMYALDSWVILV